MKYIMSTTSTLLLAIISFAQDTHYWTQQFGTRSALLGGAVVSDMRDNSMIFYNPAAIAFIDSNSFSLNANIYKLENLRVKNILPGANDFQSLQLTAIPLLSSGQFKAKLKNVRISYGIFSPVAFQFLGRARVEGDYAVVHDDESPGMEAFVGDATLFSRLRELDVALGTSYRINEHWSAGLTHIFDVRSQNYNRAFFTHYNLNNSDNTIVSTSFTQNFNYYNVRYTPKLGVAYRGKHWSAGATITSPGIRIMGTGSAGVDLLALNNKAEDGGRGNIVANRRDFDLKSYFRSPFAVAVGAQYQNGKTMVSFTTQYFGREGVFNILQGSAQPFVSPASAFSLIQGNELLQVKSAARPVLNVAIGLEQTVSERISVALSLRNNQSYYDPQLLEENGIKPDISTWDIYHFIGGITRNKKRSSISIGLAFAYGSDDKRIEQYLPLPSDTPFYQKVSTTTPATYTSLGVLLGYNYFFKND
jgi:hypothetical protein